jgi:20S proteasome alpha/beta subunit
VKLIVWMFVIVSAVITPSIGLFVVVAQQQNPLTMNGGSVLAMAGKNCVVLAVDKRFGSGRSLINVRNRPVIQIPPSSIVAFTGMEGDVQSLHIELNAQIIDKYYRGLGFGERSRNKNQQDTSSASVSDVKGVAMLTSHILYRRKRAPYYVEPVVVGLRLDGWEEHTKSNQSDLEDPTSVITTTSPNTNHVSVSEDTATNLCENSSIHQAATDSLVEQPNRVLGRRLRYRPYLCCMDMIGAKSESEAFACAGTASKSLYGTAEALWEPDLSPDELVSICTNAFLSALERDCLSGYGATVYLLTPEGITEYDISGRSD